MRLQRVDQLRVYYQPESTRRVKVGRLALKDREILFEYDPEFLAGALELSPFKLPLRPGVTVGPPLPFDGLMGVFDDSLPDGWGKLLIDRRAAELGISSGTLTQLDRLALVGARSMGALTYEPEVSVEEPTIVRLADLAADVEKVIDGAKTADLERLIALGGSPKGARPKVLVQMAPNGDIRYGARDIRTDYTAWLVKFPAPGDDRHAGPLEHAYCMMAREAGIDVPRTMLLGGTKRRAGYFAIERFDRRDHQRRHVHTLGGLLHLPHGYKAFDYVELLQTTRRLTRDESAVIEMYRRACFNVIAHNRDDHPHNFAFVMAEDGTWACSPAYDLTFVTGPGGEHTMLVAGEGRDPTRQHLLALAEKADVKARRAKAVLDQVEDAIARFEDFAKEATVPTKLRAFVSKQLERWRRS